MERMSDLELEKEPQKEEQEKLLPLVIEIMPGQAGIGLIDVYQPGSYEKKTLRELCDETLKKLNWSVEEREVLEDIEQQLDGGVLLSGGKTIDREALHYAVQEITEAGEEYFYVPVRALKPQEGGT